MGNTTEKLRGIITVSDGKPKEEADPIIEELNKIEIVRIRQDTHAFAGLGLESQSFEKIKDYLTSIHRYKTQTILEKQETIVKKCQNVDVITNSALHERIGSIAV